MYKRILLAYDGTREGLVALREGALLAKRCGAEVFLLSVVPETAGLLVADGVHCGVLEQQMGAYKSVLERGVAVSRQLGLEPTARMVAGEPAPQIGAYAKEVGADLVVLGHRRQNFLGRWWSGATGAYVTDFVQCSVLVGRNPISEEVFEAELKTTAGEAGAPARVQVESAAVAS